jgi:hypothetical protein
MAFGLVKHILAFGHNELIELTMAFAHKLIKLIWPSTSS